MVQTPTSFTFDYFGGDIVYGRGCVSKLETLLSERGLERAMVVTGSNVGKNEAVMGPITEGLGSRMGTIFDQTTPAKTAATVFDGIAALTESDADVIVGVGGGSSLDIARQISAYKADGRPLSAYREAAREGTLTPPSPGAAPTPVVVIPTTLAGADISSAGAVAVLTPEESSTGEAVRLSGPVEPTGMVYDPNLFETTPDSVLTGSAMNGFDKAIETIYANNSSPITQATAVHSLRLFSDALPQATAGGSAMDKSVVGIILAQFRRRISVIHSFGHGVARHHPVHQGLVHGVVAPHVLRYIFEKVDGERQLLATGLGVAGGGKSADELADAVVEAVAEIRDGLGLPTRLRDLEGVPEEHIPMIAELTLADAKMSQAPDGLNPTVEEIESVLRQAW